MAENEIIYYLKTISEKTDDIRQEIVNLNRRVEILEEKVDMVESKLSTRIDEVEEKLSARIDKLETRIDVVEDKLSAKIDMVEDALDTEIDAVYQIALLNKNHIEILLIPYNDRNFHANEEIAKISRMEERINNIENVVGKHSEAIRRLETA